MTSSNSALGGLIQRIARGVNITSDAFFSGSVVIGSEPTNDDTLIFSMSPSTTSSEFTDISSYTRTITGNYNVGTNNTKVNGEYAIMNTTTSFVETDLGISGEADFSVGFWLYSPVENVSRILSIGRAGTVIEGEGFFDVYLNNSRLVFTMSSTTTPPTSTTGETMIVPIAIREWNHIVFTYSKNTRIMSVHINANFKSSIARIDESWGITEGKAFLRAGAETEIPTNTGWWIARINIAWGRIWDSDDIRGLVGNNWKPKLGLKNALFSKIARLTEVINSKASLISPIFTGTVSLPETDAVLYNGETLSSLLTTAGGVPTMSFGTPKLLGTDTIVVPFRNVENTADLDIGTTYNAMITANTITYEPDSTLMVHYIFNNNLDSSIYNQVFNIGGLSTTNTDDPLKVGYLNVVKQTVSTNNMSASIGTVRLLPLPQTVSFYLFMSQFPVEATGIYNHHIFTLGENVPSTLSRTNARSDIGSQGYTLNISTDAGTTVIDINTLVENTSGVQSILVVHRFLATQFTLNKWVHVGIRSIGHPNTLNAWGLYLDGVEVPINSRFGTDMQSTNSLNGLSPSAILTINGRSRSTDNSIIKISNFKIWKRLLTVEELIREANITSLIFSFITHIVSRNTKDIRFKLLQQGFEYIPIFPNRNLLKLNATIIDGSLIKASADIPVANIQGLGALDFLGNTVYTETVGAYALRRLYEIYTGAQVRIRRSSDNVLADIWFDKVGTPISLVSSTETITNPSIETWLAGATAQVITLYDQSPSANNMNAWDTRKPSLVLRYGLWKLFFQTDNSTSMDNQGSALSSSATIPYNISNNMWSFQKLVEFQSFGINIRAFPFSIQSTAIPTVRNSRWNLGYQHYDSFYSSIITTPITHTLSFLGNNNVSLYENANLIATKGVLNASTTTGFLGVNAYDFTQWTGWLEALFLWKPTATIQYDLSTWFQGTPILENPRFLANIGPGNIASDYNSKYGWDTDQGWAMSASSATSTRPPWIIADKNSSDGWATDPTQQSSPPYWVKMQFPVQRAVQSYSITHTTYGIPIEWVVQGSNDNQNWTDTETIRTQPRTASSYVDQTLKYEINADGVKYKYYRLYIINSSRNSSDTLTNNYVYILEWKLFVKM